MSHNADSIDKAASQGDLEKVKELLDLGWHFTLYAIENAVDANNFEIVKLLYDIAGKTLRGTIQVARYKGNPEIIEYLETRERIRCGKEFEYQAEAWHPEDFKYIQDGIESKRKVKQKN
jgi:hypothetical protein